MWHKRLGHPTNEVLSVMLNKSQLSSIVDNQCSICSNFINGKMSRLPFPTESTRCLIPFERIHTYIWCLSPVKFIEGFRYDITFVDGCTKFVWIFPLFNKSDVFAIFVKFYTFISVQFGAFVKWLQSDNGGEFVSKQF